MFKNGFLFVRVFDVCTKFLKLQVLRLPGGASPLVEQSKIVLRAESAFRKSVYLPALPADSKPISLVLSPMEARSFGNAVARVHYTSPNSISLSYEHFKLAACEFLARRPLVDRHMTAIPFWF